jgi:signal transduction histidine kinase
MVLDRTRAYSGNDRRGGVGTAAWGDAFGLAAAVLLASVVGLGLLATAHPHIAGDRLAGLAELFETLSGAFAVGAFILCLLRWRLLGDALALWVGAAALVFGVVVIGTAELALPLIAALPRLRAVVPASYGAGLLGTTVLFLGALVAPPIDSRLRAWRVAVAALAIVGLAAVVLDHLASVQTLLTAAHPVVARPGVRSTARPGVSVPLALLGVGFVVRGARRNLPLLAWSGLAVLALAIGELAGALQRSASDLWVPGGHLLRAVGFLLLMIGCSRDLSRSYVDQRGRLFDSQVAMRSVETRERVKRAGARRRDHDLRGSLMAIEGAALTLQRQNEALSADTREQLTRMLSGEISRLQKLVAAAGQPQGDFTLADAVRAAVDGAAVDGGEVTLDVTASPAVSGSPTDTADVVRELVAAAMAESGGANGPLAVELTQEPDWGLVRLRFRSAVFPRHERRAILARRLSGAVSDQVVGGMSLHVVDQLVRDQGGELSLHDQDGGNLCFELRLPITKATL